MNFKKPLPIIKEEDVMPIDKTAIKCAPHLEFENGSCIPLELLIHMAEAYNKYINNDELKIKLSPKLDTLYPDDYKKYLLFEFKKKFEGDQKDWIKSEYLQLMSEEAKDDLENKVFRPEGPQGRFDWLSTIDINKVLSQYEEKYPGFKFLGAVPMDFMELDYLPFKTLDFDDLKKDNIIKFGIIFNTDKSWQSGKHWISLYCDLEKRQIYFSDSIGIRPPKEVVNFIELIEKYIKKNINDNSDKIGGNNNDIDIRYNKTEHQKGNSECGVYSINFILRLLKGKTFDHITTKRLTDKQVNKCRIKYFGNADEKEFKNE